MLPRILAVSLASLAVALALASQFVAALSLTLAAGVWAHNAIKEE